MDDGENCFTGQAFILTLPYCNVLNLHLFSGLEKQEKGSGTYDQQVRFQRL